MIDAAPLASQAEKAPVATEVEVGVVRRPIRSFVLRTGRITPAQQRAFDQHWARFGLDYHACGKDFDAVFARAAQRVVEIGFGNGEALCFAAANEPEHDFIGIEVHTPGVGKLLNDLANANLSNARIYRHDAVEVLRLEIAPASLAQVRVYFPDPWHKKRHHKRRLIRPEFVELIASRLAAGGLLHLATDWAEYAAHMMDVVEANPQFENIAGPRTAVTRPAWRLPTRFEGRGLRLGHQVADLLYRKV